MRAYQTVSVAFDKLEKKKTSKINKIASESNVGLPLLTTMSASVNHEVKHS